MTNEPLYAVGDIHGHLDQLEHVLELIVRDGGETSEIVFLGDLVDRGPNSSAVIQMLMDGQIAGRPWHVLKGNHDRMFSRFLADATIHDPRILSRKSWLHPVMGGLNTLASYGVDTRENRKTADLHAEARTCVPKEHLAFVANLPVFLERGDLLFVHAGIVPGVPLDEQSEDDLIWIRDPFLNFSDPHPWLIVHGHTAIEMPHHFGNRIDLDGGAGRGRDLYPAVFEGKDCWLLTEGGRIPLVP